MPMTPFMGVLISWLMLARNSDLARLAASAPPGSFPLLDLRSEPPVQLFSSMLGREAVDDVAVDAVCVEEHDGDEEEDENPEKNMFEATEVDHIESEGKQGGDEKGCIHSADHPEGG